jgi:ribonuclease HII
LDSLKHNYSGSAFEAGCDEAGRGCLAGPVCAAAVILGPGTSITGLNDSKQLSAAARAELRIKIEADAMTWSVGWASVEEIDKYNILNASILAMHRALEGLNSQPDFILVDGHRFKAFRNIPHQCIISGDALWQSIAAASILAKTHRDQLMTALHVELPQYGWIRNKGYPTMEHRLALLHHGMSPYHRKSFHPNLQLSLPF